MAKRDPLPNPIGPRRLPIAFHGPTAAVAGGLAGFLLSRHGRTAVISARPAAADAGGRSRRRAVARVPFSSATASRPA